MKNTNVFIYLILGGLIVFLAVFSFYVWKNKTEEINILKIENEQFKNCRPISKFLLGDISADISRKINFAYSQREDMQDVFAEIENLDKNIIYCGTEYSIIKSLTEENMKESTEMAQEALFIKTVSGMSAQVMACMDEEKFINAPQKGAEVCQGGSNWSDFGDIPGGASWDGCDFEIDKKARTFKFCATYEDVLMLCTENGCSR
ncbi:MAG: hypothetical protein RBS77_06035 [Candidatus Moranbacteria bacterium]|jgi:hypothetical protein|nr:hypothetical protein [Candidatus Moranbacteria bacterium]